MKRNLVILALIVLVAVNISALATIIHDRSSRGSRAGVGRPRGHPIVYLREHLGLDDSQIAEFEARRESFERDNEKLHDRMEERRKALMEELRAEYPDTLRIDQIVDEIGTLQADLQKRALRHMLQEQEILTPEQREKFFSMFDRHFHQRGQMPWGSHRRSKGPHSRPSGPGSKDGQEKPPRHSVDDHTGKGRRP
jgi:Spy/CpxP family protein refolding chaperone